MRSTLLLLLVFVIEVKADTTVSRTLSLVGKARYQENFRHFAYVNPDAPKGGALKLAVTGSFDTLIPFTSKGTAPEGITTNTYNKLMIRSADEPYSLYPLIAEFIEYPDDYSWVAFHVNPLARFNDGHPITADDLTFSFNTLKESGSPFFKNLYHGVSHAEKTGPLRVKFHLQTPGLKLIALLAFMNILPKHYWQKRQFDNQSLEIPVSSGPMQIESFKRGQSITYKRVKDYWARDLPVNRGRFNFDTVQIDFFRDKNARMEGFRAGLYDFVAEGDISQWRQSYDFPAVHQGRVIKEDLDLLYPPGMSALVFNTRKAKFRNRRVRQALLTVFDFESINRRLLYSGHRRTTSLYANTELEATGLVTEAELELLSPYRKELPEELFTQELRLPESDGSGNNRQNQRLALQLLKAAGWQLRKGKMTHLASNTPMTITLISDNFSQEKLLLPFRKSLADIGIDLSIVTLDKSLFRKRARSFDFDMIDWRYWHSIFPGQEQYNSWSSSTAQQLNSGNVAGVSSRVVDDLLQRFSQARTYEQLIPIGRAMDRVLMWGYYMIPKWHSTTAHIAYWDHLQHPPHEHLYWWSLTDWWIKPPAK